MSKPNRRRAIVLDRLPELACRHRDCAHWKAAGCWHATLCMDFEPPKTGKHTTARSVRQQRRPCCGAPYTHSCLAHCHLAAIATEGAA